ncbi:Protein FAR1-like sequence 5 [Apostasia shenzhenica]|uniref:Protein FAR1-like sequence 5 n=1 Tax=Apostasia shenzhenica TaxID=1088818 RepID=A0A2I0A889_9ASPA|nr:Protein FAR1-like sequence 5 [Apostasia shenzhenica]
MGESQQPGLKAGRSDIDLEKGGESEAVSSSDFLQFEEGKRDLLGQIVDSEIEAYKLYCDYAHYVGFSVRKGKNTYFLGTKDIKAKEFLCSKAGFKEDEPDASHCKLESRTGCKAMVKFQVDGNGKWRVSRLVAEHNHDLAKPEERHLLRSARSVTASKMTSVFRTLLGAGIKTTKVSAYLFDEGTGIENMKFSKKEGQELINSQNLTEVEPGDSQSLVNLFKERAAQDAMFFWDIQLDKEGKLTNFFWRDGRSRIDYDCFGDVVIFDTTYRLNKYVCAPFLGINNHGQTITFGVAFLMDETTESFVWLFNTFLKSMGDRQPITIFTNLHEAMDKAVEMAFSTSHHRFCVWHISKNAPTHVHNFNSDKELKVLFTKCMQECDSEIEFEETWRNMLAKGNLDSHEWLRYLYGSRRKWSTAFNKDNFDLGIKSTLRTGINNNVLNIIPNTSSLTQCFIQVEKLLHGWRQSEANEDFNCNQSTPACAIKHSPILRHASQVYTNKMYKLFEREFLDGLGGLSFEEFPCGGGSLCQFKMKMHDEGEKEWVVNFDSFTMEVECNCKKFRSMGILCLHALKAFSLKNIARIPDKYIMKRWTKEARKGIYNLGQSEQSQPENMESDFVYLNHVSRYCYDLATRSQQHLGARKILINALETAERNLEVFFSEQCFSDANSEKRLKKSRKENDSGNQFSLGDAARNVSPSGTNSVVLPHYWSIMGPFDDGSLPQPHSF